MPSVFILMTKKQQSRIARIRKHNDEIALMSLDINTGVEKLRPEDLLQREVPGRVDDAFVRGRAWHRDNWFVQQICQMKQDFYNYDLQITPATPKAKKAVANVLADPMQRAELRRYIDSVWSEYILHQTVVSFWRKENTTHPFLLLPENCEYSDAFGIEKLRVALNYKKSDLEDDGKNGVVGLNPSQLARYAGNKKITLSEAEDEYFKVLTENLKGQGFGWPRLRRVFRTLSQNESMEIGEFMYALAGRLVVREHKIGFEVRSGANAMRQEAYLWKKKRSDEIQKFFAGRNGLCETVQQFDHNMAVHWVDPKFYDARKWDTIINRCMFWAGPLGFMLMAKTPNPYLLPMLEVQAKAERLKVADHCEYVISEGFGLPVKLQWGNRCFRDPRLGWDMAKFYTSQGPLSLTTGLEEGGWDPEVEAERKKEEAKASRKDELFPLYDVHHGNRPGEPEGAGRPQTSTNPKPKA